MVVAGRVVIWTAPAERSGDGAFPRANQAMSSAKAASRCACRRSPNLPVNWRSGFKARLPRVRGTSRQPVLAVFFY